MEEGIHFGMFHYIYQINIYMNNIYVRVKEAPELPERLLLLVFFLCNEMNNEMKIIWCFHCSKVGFLLRFFVIFYYHLH